MGTTIPPLPLRPDFPVYCRRESDLDEHFLALWNLHPSSTSEEVVVDYVEIGSRKPGEQPHSLVVTRPIRDRDSSTSPLGDVVGAGLLALSRADLGHILPAIDPAGAIAILQKDVSSQESPWEDGGISADGVEYPARVLSWPQGLLACAVVKGVPVAAVSRSVTPTELDLVQMSEAQVDQLARQAP